MTSDCFCVTSCNNIMRRISIIFMHCRNQYHSHLIHKDLVFKSNNSRCSHFVNRISNSSQNNEITWMEFHLLTSHCRTDWAKNRSEQATVVIFSRKLRIHTSRICKRLAKRGARWRPILVGNSYSNSIFFYW